VKLLSKTLLALYLLILLWLVLFKFSLDLSSVLDYQTRSLNLIPFADFSRNSLREMIFNFAVTTQVPKRPVKGDHGRQQ
jgi:glycopeptide antibiotics resistance protein